MAGKLVWSQLIAAPPALVVTISQDAHVFLDGLDSSPDNPDVQFNKVADTKALWAVQVDFDPSGGIEGSIFPATGGTASAWVVSAEAYKRLKAIRF